VHVPWISVQSFMGFRHVLFVETNRGK
jgi:hypothetical protein